MDHLVLIVFAVFPVTDNEPWTKSGAALNVVNSLYE
jgi:hypothetical protein